MPAQLDEGRLVEHAIVVDQTKAELPPLAPARDLASVVGRVEVGAEGAVQGEVGVAADGACEVRVVVGREGEVPDQGWAVGGLGERPQHREVDGPDCGRVPSRLEQALEVVAGWLVGNRLAGGPGVHPQLLEVAAHGLRVDAADDRHPDAVEGAGEGFVGLDHEHLDDGVGEGVVLGNGVDDVAGVVEDQLHLRKLEHDHAVAQPALPQPAGEIVGEPKGLDQLVGVGRLCPGVGAGGLGIAVDERLGFQVSQALPGADHG